MNNNCHFDQHIVYCQTFIEALELSHHRKGISIAPIGKKGSTDVWELPIVKSGDYSKNGVALAFCPFCGVDLMELVAKQKEYENA